MSESAWAWCPECKKWVPAQSMNYSREGDKLIRVCNYCLDGISDTTKFVYDPHHESTQCIYCDSWDTQELKPDWGKYKCNNCQEIFRRL